MLDLSEFMTKPGDFGGSQTSSLDAALISDQVNRHINEIFKGSEIVSNNKDKGGGWLPQSDLTKNDTHQAIMLRLKLIKKDCEHTRVVFQWGNSQPICKDCNKEIKPKGGWVLDEDPDPTKIKPTPTPTCGSRRSP